MIAKNIESTSQIILAFKTAVIIFSAMIMYYKDLFILVNGALQNEFMSYLLAIPFLIIFLLYNKRKILRSVIAFETRTRRNGTNQIVGLSLCIISILLYWIGSYSLQPIQIHVISLPIFIAGCVLIVFNPRTLRELAFPIIFLGFLVPPTLEFVSTTGATLSTQSSSIAYTILKLIGFPVSIIKRYEIPTIILELPQDVQIFFAIDIPCAGMYSLMGFTIFAFFSAYIARGPMWKRALIFLIGFPFIYTLNIFRIIVIVLIGYQFGEELAMQIFHLLGGWILILIGTLILLILSERLLKIQFFGHKSSRPSCQECINTSEMNQNACEVCGRIITPMSIKTDKREVSKLLFLVAFIFLLAQLQLPIFSMTKADVKIDLQDTSGEQEYVQLLPDISDYRLRFVYRDREFEEQTNQDASLVYIYSHNDYRQTPIWVVLEIAKDWGVLHRWEVCLGDQPTNIKIDLKKIELWENPPIIGRYYAFQGSESIQTTLYWYERFLFEVEQGFEKKYIKTSLIVFTDDLEKTLELDDSLSTLAKKVIDHWQPIKISTRIIFVVSQYGPILILTTIALLILTIVFRYINELKERRSYLKAFHTLKLEEEKLLIISVHEANNQGKSSATEIASIYNELGGKPMGISTMLAKLNQAEKAGFITKTISNKDGEPILGWKSRTPFPKGKGLSF